MVQWDRIDRLDWEAGIGRVGWVVGIGRDVVGWCQCYRMGWLGGWCWGRVVGWLVECEEGGVWFVGVREWYGMVRNGMGSDGMGWGVLLVF